MKQRYSITGARTNGVIVYIDLMYTNNRSSLVRLTAIYSPFEIFETCADLEASNARGRLSTDQFQSPHRPFSPTHHKKLHLHPNPCSLHAPQIEFALRALVFKMKVGCHREHEGRVAPLLRQAGSFLFCILVGPLVPSGITSHCNCGIHGSI